jgi:hypothetical protein
MTVLVTDSEIAALLSEPKRLPADYKRRLGVKIKSGHKESEIDLKGMSGSEFKIITRQSTLNPLDFSVILAYRRVPSNSLFRLRRYNGKGHHHTNKIEGQTFYDFHVHTATERYQLKGFREDAFAERTKSFFDFSSAFDQMIRECNMISPDDKQTELFQGGK